MKTCTDALRGKLVVSCQAAGASPLAGPGFMAAMARAAEIAGAAGVRVNGPDDIAAVRSAVGIPIIGIFKRRELDADVYITPTPEDARAVRSAGADIVAIDATSRPRSHGPPLQELISAIRGFDASLPIMADVSTVDEGVAAARFGVDLVATTLSGYTPYSPQQGAPDIELVRTLAATTSCPVVAEGRFWEPWQVAEAFSAGAYSVVVGKAITNPVAIARRFVEVTPGRAPGVSPGAEGAVANEAAEHGAEP